MKDETSEVVKHTFSGLILFAMVAIIIMTWLHYLGTKHRREKTNTEPNSTQQFCIYGVFLVNFICSIFCNSLHNSQTLKFSHDYCRHGTTFCVILYSIHKSFSYGFFLIRAKFSQGLTPILSKIWFEKIIPCYIIIYCLCFIILGIIFFKGLDLKESKYPSDCIIDHTQAWYITIAAVVDVFNCIFFLTLFVYPIYHTIKGTRKIQNDANDSVDFNSKAYIRLLIFNTITSSIATSSSLIFLILLVAYFRENAPYLLWPVANIDMLINTTCCFIIINTNRKYGKYLFLHYCCGNKTYNPFHKTFNAQTPVGSLNNMPSSTQLTDIQLHSYYNDENVQNTPV